MTAERTGCFQRASQEAESLIWKINRYVPQF